MKEKGIKNNIASQSVIGDLNKIPEIVKKYGTYEVQATADTKNAFPKIAQGLPKIENRKNSEE